MEEIWNREEKDRKVKKDSQIKRARFLWFGAWEEREKDVNEQRGRDGQIGKRNQS